MASAAPVDHNTGNLAFAGVPVKPLDEAAQGAKLEIGMSATKEAPPPPPPEEDERAKLIKEIKSYALPQQINIFPDIEKLQEKTSIYKGSLPLGKLYFLGVLAGLWVGVAVCLVFALGGGIPADIRSLWPILTKLCAGLFFPVAIFLIILFGGELFTGNAMVMTIGFLSGRVTPLQIIYNWFFVLLSNFSGCVFYMYFFMSLVELFEKEPFKSFVVSTATSKMRLAYHVCFLKAIPANALVCTSVLLGQLSQHLSGRLMAMFFPIMIFAIIGYEHAIANMAFIPGGFYYGADKTDDYGKWLGTNLLLAILGNLVGGGFMVGGTVWYLFSWTTHYGRVTKPSTAPIMTQLRRGRSGLTSFIVWNNS